jgi:copper transport protein
MPADGATLASSPETVRLHFDEPVRLISLGLVGPQGAVAATEVPAVTGDVLTARFPPGLPVK